MRIQNKRISAIPIIAVLVLIGWSVSKNTRCLPPEHGDAGPDADAPLSVRNETDASTVVSVAFGADSVVTSASWSFCVTDAGASSCEFSVPPFSEQDLPLGGEYLNATLAFQAGGVGCGTTKSELNVNNPSWYDIVDISLVDGYSNPIRIEVTDSSGSHVLGPVLDASGNEKAFGVFPLGCDICVARQKPSCGMKPGADGCKKGPDQYHPDVPCQFQGAAMGGSATTIKISVLGT